jgi:hypothetical protein
MDDVAAHVKKAAIDQALINVSSEVGVAFGIKLFDEFRRRGWFELKELTVSGSTLFRAKIPVYQGAHCVFPTWDLPEYDFEVGRKVAIPWSTPH